MNSLTQPVVSGKLRDMIQLGVGYILILAVIWSPRSTQRPLYILAFAFIFAATWVSFEGWSAMGFRYTNLLRSLWAPALALGLAVVAIGIAMHYRTLHPVGGFQLYVRNFWGYAIWSFAQQWLLQGFFLLRLIRVLPGKRYAAVGAASIFAVAHLPNPILTAVTLIWGFIACHLFLRYRNVYTLAITHAILGICLAISVPGPLIHNMRVGLGYLTYQRHQVADLSVYRFDLNHS